MASRRREEGVVDIENKYRRPPGSEFLIHARQNLGEDLRLMDLRSRETAGAWG